MAVVTGFIALVAGQLGMALNARNRGERITGVSKTKNRVTSAYVRGGVLLSAGRGRERSGVGWPAVSVADGLGPFASSFFLFCHFSFLFSFFYS